MNRRAHIFGMVAVLVTVVMKTSSISQVAALENDQRPVSAVEKIAPSLLEGTDSEPREFLVVLREQADLSATERLHTKAQKGHYVFAQLSEIAARTQQRLRRQLDESHIDYRPFWVVNMVRVHASLIEMLQIAQLPEVARLEADPRYDIAPMEHLGTSQAPQSPLTVEWNVARVGAVSVWNAGVTGEGAVVGSMDTGFEWTHPALTRQYRGNDRGIVDHSYNWHDAIHADLGPCGPDSPEPCDEDGHGTLTMGSSIGDDGAGNQIGVAPGAQWIGCRCWEPARRTHFSYVAECFEWFVAPTDLNGQNPDPSKAPHVINNSWICEFNEGCADPLILQETVENVRAAGIVVVASAGNSGDLGCESVYDPPAIYDAAFTVGSTNTRDEISPFSSRGPVVRDISGRLKPDIVAPGENVRSSGRRGTYESNSGTSFAGPIVVGTVALMISAVPSLAGDVDAIEQILIDSAFRRTTSGSCGAISNQAIPNNTFGWGRVDAWAAYQLAKARETSIDDEYSEESEAAMVVGFRLFQNRPNPFNPSTQLEYEIPRPSRVALHLYDVLGRRVRTLVGGAQRDAGRFAVEWNGRDDDDRAVASGLYFARLESDGRVLASRRLTLVR